MQDDLSNDLQRSIADTEKFWTRVTLYKLVYSICGLVTGIACVVLGTILLLNRLKGSADGAMSKGQLIGAAPWAALFIIGLFVIAVTRYSKLSGKQEYDMMNKDFAPRMSVNHRALQEIVSRRFYKTVNTFALIYSICGLAAGAGLIIGGILLSLTIISDGAGWAGHIADAILGIMLFGVGLFVITISRYGVKTKNTALLDS